MESYAFKTKCHTIGFFQKGSDECYICIDTEFFPTIKNYKWPSIKGGHDIGWKEPVSKDTIKHYIQWTAPNILADVAELVKLSKAGKYFPRLNRNNICFYKEIRGNKSYLDEIRSFYNIYNSLNDLFNYIEPTTNNLNAYGHKSRELLILACTEVEYLFLQFLKDNKYKTKPKHSYSTNDYVKCRDILKLNDYSVELVLHPDLGYFSPFKNWVDTRPTKSLSWYDAYNSVKHDRGGNFRRAALKHLIESVAAIHILLESQYGSIVFDSPMRSEFKSIFRTTLNPTWRLKELFTPLFVGEKEVTWERAKGYFANS